MSTETIAAPSKRLPTVVTRAQLLELRACSDGLALVKKHWGAEVPVTKATLRKLHELDGESFDWVVHALSSEVLTAEDSRLLRNAYVAACADVRCFHRSLRDAVRAAIPVQANPIGLIFARARVVDLYAESTRLQVVFDALAAYNLPEEE